MIAKNQKEFLKIIEGLATDDEIIACGTPTEYPCYIYIKSQCDHVAALGFVYRGDVQDLFPEIYDVQY